MRIINGYNIKEPQDWDFEIPQDSYDCIMDLLDAWVRNDGDTDCYMDELHGSLRELPEAKDELLHKYYLNGGWLNDRVN